LIENGDPVAPIAHHSGDSYQNTYSTARISYYGISGFPTVKFDGILSAVGASGNMYPSYLAKVNQRMAIMSDFTMAVNGMSDGLDYTVIVTVDNVEPNASTTLVLHFAICESHIPENWGGLNEVNHVNRLMVPGANGTPLSFTEKSEETIELNFSLQSGWATENIDFVAFVQDNSNKEVLQGFMVALDDMMPMFFDNAGCLAVNMLPVTNCSGEVAPTITISNYGAASLTSLDINYQVNTEDVNTYQWSGDLGYGEMEAVDLPSTSFTLLEENDLMIYTANPNGNPDEDTSNDTIASTFVSALEVVPDIHLYLKLDDNPGETTWEVKNSAGDVLYSGGPYTQSLQFLQETFDLTEDDCYTFVIYDAGGDGLTGPGFFTLRESDLSLIYDNQDFAGTEELVQFSINQTSIPDNALAEFNVYPNPFENYTNVSFTLDETTDVNLSVYNVIGKVVYNVQNMGMGSGNHSLIIDTQEFAQGIYFVNLKVGDKLYTKKISSH